MDCCAFNTAASYAIKPLYESLRTQYKTTLYKDVIHAVIAKDDFICDAFYFSYGVAIFWGVPKSIGQTILKDTIEGFENQRSSEIESDEFSYVHQKNGAAKIIDDEILLPDEDILTKLAISQGIAQSVELSAFETAMQRTFNATKHIPEELAREGKISLSRKQIRRIMGELFIERNSINLHMDVLDTPEFFWDHSDLEPLYQMTASYLDIHPRVEVLNQRLDVVHNLFEMLGNELNHLHSSRLEVTIICLIVIEVAITFLRDFFHII